MNGLHELFLNGLAKNPGGTALRIGADDITYEQLHELALNWAGALLDAGDEPPKAVGILAGKTLESYAGLLAALYTGAAAVPLHPGFPAARTRRMLDASGLGVVIADREGLAVLAECAPELRALSPFEHGGIDAKRALDAPLPVKSSDTAYMLFTSGSTGRPKGVPIPHGATRHYFDVLAQRYDFHSGDVFSQSFDLNFDCAMFDLFCAWGVGASAHPLPASAYRDLPAFVAERRMTVWFSTPSAIALVRRMGGLDPGAMPDLCWSFFAGEALKAADAQDWLDAAPHTTLENIYGPTELTVTITGHRWSPERSPDLCLNGLVPIGRVHDGHDFVLITPDGAASDTEGELCITGPQMTPGYLDPSDDTGRFLERDGRRWYRTGDRVRRHACGELVYLGRLDAQVQVNGWRVELSEVEHALRACDGVQDAVVVTRPVDAGVELAVFYTGTRTSPAELTRQLRKTLPAGMLPRSYEHLTEFPLNSNRKIDRGVLAGRAAA